jgi:hypothetical protein
LSESLAYPSGEEEGNFLVQIISTGLPSHTEGRGGWHPVDFSRFSKVSRMVGSMHFCENFQQEKRLERIYCINSAFSTKEMFIKNSYLKKIIQFRN